MKLLTIKYSWLLMKIQATYWQTEKAAADQSLTIDIGCVKSIKGFAYTPQKANQEGMFERGTIWVSMDNQKGKSG